MRVTIGIPVFNCEQWIGSAIASAVQQTWPDKEVIVVDDGSNDSTPAVCEKWKDHVRYERQERCGGNRARNRILELAQGEWIQYLDADDYLDPAKVEHQLSSLGSNSADLILSPTRIEHWSGDQLVSSSEQVSPQPPDWINLWLGWNMPQTGGCLWKTRFLRQINGWNEKFTCNQDYELYLRALQADARCFYVQEAEAAYRHWSDKTVSRKDKSAVIKGRTDLIKNCLEWLERSGRNTAIYKRQAGIVCFESARTLAAENLAAAEAYFAQRKREGLIHVTGPAAPLRYRLSMRLLGFGGAERLAHRLRRPIS